MTKLSSNYDKFPVNRVKGFDDHCVSSWRKIRELISGEVIAQKRAIIIVECYAGVDDQELKTNLSELPGVSLIDVSDAYKTPEEIEALIYPDITDDPVFGKLTTLTIDDYFDHDKLRGIRQQVSEYQNGILLLYGTGASQVVKEYDLLICADMARWEIQQRMRDHRLNNLGVENKHLEFNYQYKQAFFVDWRVCDKIKRDLLKKFDYLIDTNSPNDPKMITGEALRGGLKQIAGRPFRLVPFFDPGPWGGQWMKEVCDLDARKENFAWCFDCVPEENSLLLGFGDIVVEIPSLDLIFCQPEQVLGRDIYECLGPEFPIRFDFLDTMDGGNLSLQVHPLAGYMREHFGLTYTQDESYYLLDVGDGAEVYLGLKEAIDRDEMIEALKSAQNGGEPFNAEKFVETWKVKKHDHVLIPAGTIHCSGKNSMVLEVSATPYIFTFKLWDWGRMGLDGKPRPINIDHGENVIQWDRTASWTRDNLINRITRIGEDENWQEEQTGLHEFEFIETRRHWFTGKVEHNTQGHLNVINLVEGREVIVESPIGAFEPFIVHYVETFIVPANVGPYTIRPYGEGEGQQCATLKAYVRPEKLKALGNDLWMMHRSNHSAAELPKF